VLAIAFPQTTESIFKTRSDGHCDAERKSKGLRAFAQSRLTAGLGITSLSSECCAALSRRLIYQPSFWRDENTIFAAIIFRMSFARDDCYAAKVKDCIEFVFDVGVMKSDDRIGSTDIFNAYFEDAIELIFAVAPIVRNLLALSSFQGSLKERFLLSLREGH
jgi:hypothetical protein